MPRSDRRTEEQLRRPGAVGVPVQLQDGAFWLIPGAPLGADSSERFSELLALRELTQEAILAAQARSTMCAAWSTYMRVGAELALLALLALQMNYPGIDPGRDFPGLVTLHQLPRILSIVAGTFAVEELLPGMRAELAGRQPTS